MHGFFLRWMPLFSLLVYLGIGAQTTTNHSLYVSKGKSAFLKCQVNSKYVFFWIGPNDDIYTYGLFAINPSLSKNTQIVGNITNGEYNMQINNVTKRDEGIYKCVRGQGNNKSRKVTVVKLTIRVKPKNLIIHGTVDGKLFGQEGKSLQLICTVISGIPKETLTWYNMSTAVDTGGPEMLNITITPSRYDDNKNYTCRVNSDSLQALLQETVTLEIQYPPTIQIIKNVTNRILRCEPNGVPRNYRYFRWQHLSEYGQLIRLLPNYQTIQMDQNSANIDNFKLSGIYVCSAENGVADTHGSTVQTGEVPVLLQDKPRIVAATENIQYGLVGTQIDISVMVYCYPEFSSVNILTSDECCFNETKYQFVTEFNITVSSFKQTVLMKGYKILLAGFTLTEKDFTTYSFWIQNEIGDETISVKLMSRDTLSNSQSGYGSVLMIMGCIVVGIVICSIGSNMYCYRKRNRRINEMIETYPEEHYDEIGTINYDNVVFEPRTDVSQENNVMNIVAGDSDVLLRVGSERSEESSLESLTGITQSGDGYENPYQSINHENIEMHPYSIIASNNYQNTIIFPTFVGKKNIKRSNIAGETSKSPWLIIHNTKECTEYINRYGKKIY